MFQACQLNFTLFILRLGARLLWFFFFFLRLPTHFHKIFCKYFFEYLENFTIVFKLFLQICLNFVHSQTSSPPLDWRRQYLNWTYTRSMTSLRGCKRSTKFQNWVKIVSLPKNLGEKQKKLRSFFLKQCTVFLEKKEKCFSKVFFF